MCICLLMCCMPSVACVRSAQIVDAVGSTEVGGESERLAVAQVSRLSPKSSPAISFKVVDLTISSGVTALDRPKSLVTMSL